MSAGIGKAGFKESLLKAYARSFPIRSGKLRVINRLWRFCLIDRNTVREANLVFGDMKMRCDLREMLQRQIYFFGTYFIEREMLDQWLYYAANAEIVFDVGANSGIYGIAAKAAQPRSQIYAFEPTPEMAQLLRVNAELNRLENFDVVEVAVADRTGTAALHRWRGEIGDNEGMNYITLNGNDTSERVKVTSIDAFCRRHAISRIDLLKLDIQGQEHRALNGARQILMERRVGTIFLELNWAEGAPEDCPARQSLAILEEAGYQFSAIGGEPELDPRGAAIRSHSDVVAKSPGFCR